MSEETQDQPREQEAPKPDKRTKAELAADNERLAQELELLREELRAAFRQQEEPAPEPAAEEQPVAEEAPAPEPEDLVEEVLFESSRRGAVVNFPFREGQGRRQFGMRPAQAEFQPFGHIGLYRTQDPKEIEWLEKMDLYGVRVRDRYLAKRDPEGGAPQVARLTPELAAAIDVRSAVDPNEQGEPV